MFYFSNPVFSAAEHQGLIINTDYVNRESMYTSSPVATATAAYVHVTKFGDSMNPLNTSSGSDRSLDSTNERTWSVSSISASKRMTVTIPEGSRPGTMLTVATPDGNIVNVSILYLQ